MRAVSPLALVAATMLSGAPVGAQTLPEVPASSMSLPARMAEAYREDAARLAVRHLARLSPAADRSPRIPPRLIETLFNALAHVYASDSAARAAVTERFNIHTYENPPLYELMVGVSPLVPWAGALQRGIGATGEPAFDGLVRDYALVLARPSVLRSLRPLDIEALAARFARIPGVRYAEGNGVIGDGNEIEAAVVDDAWRLDFSRGWGDCPAGCIMRHVWSFRVARDGIVTFLGSRGPTP